MSINMMAEFWFFFKSISTIFWSDSPSAIQHPIYCTPITINKIDSKNVMQGSKSHFKAKPYLPWVPDYCNWPTSYLCDGSLEKLRTARKLQFAIGLYSYIIQYVTAFICMSASILYVLIPNIVAKYNVLHLKLRYTVDKIQVY
jgi:hypothetical protein